MSDGEARRHEGRRTRRGGPYRGAVLLMMILACQPGCSDGSAEEAQAGPVRARPAGLPGDLAAPRAPRPDGPLASGTACVSAGCHAEFGTARFVHGVLRTTEACSVCHEADRGGHVYPLKRPGGAGCTFCHQSVTGQRVHQHAATMVGCVGCHDPHASDHASLLKSGSVADLCSTCHPLQRHSVTHPPFAAGECVACHDPHESSFAGLLRGGEGPDHCGLCHEALHDQMAAAARVHAPAAQDCLICHDPHGSEHRFVMHEAIDDTCFACHADLERAVAGATAPHGAMTLDAGCANCHDPHASDRPSLLKDRQEVLCLNCHGAPVTARDGRTIPDMTASVRDLPFLHGPVRSGDCTACHNVHGAAHSRLLRAKFTEDLYASFDLSQYALCFECHEPELVTAERTTALTNFRDGDRNLHYVHVNKQQRGRTCRTCHEIHGSRLPAHIAETVPFGDSGWALPIQFRPTQSGGSCAPGCHQPMSYDRLGSAAPLPAPDNNGGTP